MMKLEEEAEILRHLSVGGGMKFVDSICMNYRHDFGLLTEEEKDRIRWECIFWCKAIVKEQEA